MGIDTKLFIGNASIFDDIRDNRIEENIIKHLRETYGVVDVRYYPIRDETNYRVLWFRDGADERQLSIGRNYRDLDDSVEYPINFSLSLGCWGNSVRIMKLIAQAIEPFADKIVLIENDCIGDKVIIKDNQASLKVAKEILEKYTTSQKPIEFI